MTYSVTFAPDMPFICIQSSLFLVLGMSCSCKLNYCAFYTVPITETCGLCLTHKYSILVPFHWSVWQRTEQFSVPDTVSLEYRSIKCHRNCLWQLPIHFNWSLLVSQLTDNHSISNILCFLCRMYVWKYMVMVDNGTSCYIRNCLFLMHHRYSMKRQLPLVCPKDNALNSSLYPKLSVWNTGQSSATETAFDNYRSTSMGRF